MLSKLSTAGTSGQFRMPGHIIRMMVELMAPKPGEIVCDPACDTAGFLVAAAEYVRELKDERKRYPQRAIELPQKNETAA